MDYKICEGCRQSKSLDAFEARPRSAGGRYRLCPECAAFERSARRAGTDVAEVTRLWTAQEGGCAVCRRALDMNRRRSFHLDLDPHGRLCGLLCPKCSFGISAFRRDPVLIERAIEFLRPEKAVKASGLWEGIQNAVIEPEDEDEDEDD